MHAEVLTRWQRGWSLARGWIDYSSTDGVTTVNIGEPDRRVEYVTTSEHAATAVKLAQTDGHPPGTSWLAIAADDPAAIAPLELLRTEWLMTIALADHPIHPVPPPYRLEVTARPAVIDAHIYGYGELAASGRMTVLRSDAIADMIYTTPAHRHRGLAKATMTALTQAAHHQSATTGLLSASCEGRSLYHSLGWTTLTNLVVARTPVPSPV